MANNYQWFLVVIDLFDQHLLNSELVTQRKFIYIPREPNENVIVTTCNN